MLKEGHRRTLKQWKAEQLTLSELEFEWIRQVRGWDRRPLGRDSQVLQLQECMLRSSLNLRVDSQYISRCTNERNSVLPKKYF